MYQEVLMSATTFSVLSDISIPYCRQEQITGTMTSMDN